MIFEEVASIEKLTALVGSEIRVKQRFSDTLGKIISVDLKAHQDPYNYKVVEFLPDDGSCQPYWAASIHTFLLQP